MGLQLLPCAEPDLQASEFEHRCGVAPFEHIRLVEDAVGGGHDLLVRDDPVGTGEQNAIVELVIYDPGCTEHDTAVALLCKGLHIVDHQARRLVRLHAFPVGYVPAAVHLRIDEDIRINIVDPHPRLEEVGHGIVHESPSLNHSDFHAHGIRILLLRYLFFCSVNRKALNIRHS